MIKQQFIISLLESGITTVYAHGHAPSQIDAFRLYGQQVMHVSSARPPAPAGEPCETLQEIYEAVVHEELHKQEGTLKNTARIVTAVREAQSANEMTPYQRVSLRRNTAIAAICSCSITCRVSVAIAARGTKMLHILHCGLVLRPAPWRI